MYLKARDELIAKKRNELERGWDMVDECVSSEKDLRLVGRELCKRGEELQKKLSENWRWGALGRNKGGQRS